MLTDTITPTRTISHALALASDGGYAALHELATLTPLSAGDLCLLATGANPRMSQAGIDLALALYHEREGTHIGAHGGSVCEVCDLDAVNEYALKILLEAQR
jgi:hypothetical protein